MAETLVASGRTRALLRGRKSAAVDQISANRPSKPRRPSQPPRHSSGPRS